MAPLDRISVEAPMFCSVGMINTSTSTNDNSFPNRSFSRRRNFDKSVLTQQVEVNDGGNSKKGRDEGNRRQRQTRGRVVPKSLSSKNDDASDGMVSEVDVYDNPTKLWKLILRKDFRTALHWLNEGHADEASVWVGLKPREGSVRRETTQGNSSGASERLTGSEDSSDSRDFTARRLPIHLACSMINEQNAELRRALDPLVVKLAEVYPDGCSARDNLAGRLPIHEALRHGGCSLLVLSALLTAHPRSIMEKDHLDRTPAQILSAAESSCKSTSSSSASTTKGACSDQRQRKLLQSAISRGLDFWQRRKTKPVPTRDSHASPSTTKRERKDLRRLRFLREKKRLSNRRSLLAPIISQRCLESPQVSLDKENSPPTPTAPKKPATDAATKEENDTERQNSQNDALEIQNERHVNSLQISEDFRQGDDSVSALSSPVSSERTKERLQDQETASAPPVYGCGAEAREDPEDSPRVKFTGNTDAASFIGNRPSQSFHLGTVDTRLGGQGAMSRDAANGRDDKNTGVPDDSDAESYFDRSCVSVDLELLNRKIEEFESILETASLVSMDFY